MASLSLPRVLQLKKNSLDAEREQFERFQTLAIQKAINAIETPVKEKHVRSTIIGTFQEQSAITYWMVAVRLPFQDNRIVAWKFCHVTHKLLREGHPACLDDSQRHIGMIENLGKLWVHLREGYGKLVHLYCNLLVCKLKFHSRNPRFPGNMQLTADELDAIAENDVNNYFQLCVELFDYMDDLLNLQAAVFDSLGNARANSMTASGQCRLAALIPCAQDASQIYDCNVRLLFRLHATLPPDTLSGHRERFRQQFKKLSSFYKHASNLQYYRNLLSLPVLPSNPPNFLLQSDFGTYVTPVVSIPEPPPDEVDHVGSLIDTSDTLSQAPSDHMDDFDARPTPSPQPDPIVERDRLIDHLQNELKRMRSEVSQLVQERNTMIGSMKEHCTRLESQLHTAKVELEEEKQKGEILSIQTPEIKQKLTETEEKAKLQDEKFQKLKGAYTQLREEHIALIRQKAEVDKLSASLGAAAAQHESAKLALQQQLNDRIKDVELLQQSASSSEEIEAYKTEILNLRADLEQSRKKEVELETVRGSMEALEIEYKTATKEQEEKLAVITNELKESTETLQKILAEKEEKETELLKVRQELEHSMAKSDNNYKMVIEEKEAIMKEVEQLKQQFSQEKEELYLSNIKQRDELQTVIESLQKKMATIELNFVATCDDLTQELKEKTEQLENVIHDKDLKINETYKTLEEFQQVLDDKLKEEISREECINELRTCVQESEILKSSLAEKIKELTDQLNSEVNEKDQLQGILDVKVKDITQLEQKFKDIEHEMQQAILNFKTDFQNKESEIAELKQKYQTIVEHDLQDSRHEATILIDKLTHVTESKDKIINDLKNMVAEKETHYTMKVNTLNSDIENLSQEILRLNEALTETQAALEIGNNEIFNLKEEHEKIVESNQQNIHLKNQELRELRNKLNEISDQKLQREKDIERLTELFTSDKKVLENKFLELKECYETLSKNHIDVKSTKEALIADLNTVIKKLKIDYKNLNDDKVQEVKTLYDKIYNMEILYETSTTEKNGIIKQGEINLEKTKQELGALQTLITNERNDVDLTIAEKDRAIQLLEIRLEHVESKRLNAECELQDLLQHNTVLEADLAAVKKQLEDAQTALEKQTSRLVSCAGEAALEVTNEAIAAFEQANAHDTIKATADLAAKALEQLARHSDVSGNEESVAKSAIFAAHNTAQLSAYVADVSNVSTNMELSDKLNNECRSMLTATKECLESIKSGAVVTSSCTSAQSLVRSMQAAAALADRQNSGARCVDDELADMDRAIEEAASQIESLLAATRAGDSGVKLEVNGKILDACTTLMGAVKILVQDARKLQHELGDPKTRQKMYRKNPQWSEGLISAAKAVVFAAKLLVTSADEAVGAAGQVEGVSAAAHEVAGSTAQLVAASRARAPPDAPALARLTRASRHVAAATGALVAAVRAASALVLEQETLDTSALSLTATRRLEMESKVRSLKLETALDAERARLAALRKRHYQLAQLEENGNMENGKD